MHLFCYFLNFRSPGIMLLIFNKASSHVPLKILSIEDGTVLKSFHHLLHRNKKVDFIEQFNEKLLVKQENENLQILDVDVFINTSPCLIFLVTCSFWLAINIQVRNFELTEVSKTEFMTPSAFIFLYENQLFLTFRNRTVAVWNFRGELVTSFEDHLLWHPDCNTNNIYITSDQDLIISYCKADSNDPLSEGNGSFFDKDLHAERTFTILNALTKYYLPMQQGRSMSAIFWLGSALQRFKQAAVVPWKSTQAEMQGNVPTPQE